jgi:predicted peptidase
VSALGKQRAQVFEKDVTRRLRLPYLLYLPRGYDPEGARRWPLVLFLHGRGERGDDVGAVKRHGLPRVLERRADFPAIVVSPQCPATTYWTAEIATLTALLDAIEEEHAVDPERIYVTGLSMGGFGTWALAIAGAARFAAIAPICGGGEPLAVGALGRLPVWAFHGDADTVVPVERTLAMVEALRAHGGDVRLTIYPGVGHDSWTQTYENPELYEWLFSHTRSGRDDGPAADGERSQETRRRGGVRGEGTAGRPQSADDPRGG